MNRTFLSTFRKCTWAAWNGLGASTVPATAAVPAICAASWARAGAVAVVPPRSYREQNRQQSSAGAHGNAPLVETGFGGPPARPAPCRSGQYGRSDAVVNA